MESPWFLEFFELSDPVDPRTLKRAYASRLKSIDPAQEPVAFARLREAYELALAWVDGKQAAATPPAAAPDSPMPADAPPVIASRYLELLCANLSILGDERHVGVELDACVAAMRREHIDVPVIFEAMLINRLASGRMPWREAIFHLAQQRFHWHDVSHAYASDWHRGWIDTVEQQREALRVLASPSLIQALRMAVYGSPLPDSIIPVWPHVREAFARFPNYLSLFLDDAIRDEWSTRHASLPPAPPTPVHAQPWMRIHANGKRLYLAGLLVILAFLAVWITITLNQPKPPVYPDRTLMEVTSCRSLVSRIKDDPDINAALRAELNTCIARGFVSRKEVEAAH